VVIHLGGDVGVLQKNIVAIIDIDSPKPALANTKFIANARSQGKLIEVSQDAPKSCIIITLKNDVLVYLSPITSRTLLHRVSSGQEMSSMQNYLEKG